MNFLKNSFTKKITIISLVCISTQVFANDARRADLRTRYNQEMNICSEIKEELIVAEDAYKNYDVKLEETQTHHREIKNKIAVRRNNLELKQSIFEAENNNVAALQKKKQNAPALIRRNQATIASVQPKVPTLEETYVQAKARKKKKCDRFGGSLHKSCRSAKKSYDKAKDALNNAKKSIANAQKTINELNNIDKAIQSAKRLLKIAITNLQAEQTITPSISRLETKKIEVAGRQAELERGFDLIEQNFVKAEVKLEKCQNIRYDAHVYRSLKRYIAIFQKEGCDRAVRAISTERQQAARQGAQEAYDIACKNPQDIEVIDDRGGVQFIPYSYATGKYQNNMDKEIILEKRGAKEIKLDLDGYDIESNYDYLHIYDQNGREVAKLTNDNKNPVTELRSTGWIQGESLRLRFVTDRSTVGQGFEITGFQVKY